MSSASVLRISGSLTLVTHSMLFRLDSAQSDRLADAGYEYGPAFQGLRKAYRRGDEWFAEVALDGEHESQAAGCCVHPGTRRPRCRSRSPACACTAGAPPR